MKNLLLFIALILIVNQNTAQVAINNSGNSPNSKAMLDVSSDTMGLLIPRMTTAERTTFEAGLTIKERGMLVYDIDTNTFFYYDGTSFQEVSNGVLDVLQDADGDTKVEVEKTADEDVIHFTMDGTEYYKMYPGRIEVNNSGYSVFIGYEAGLNDDLYNRYNTAIGGYSLYSNTTGTDNAAIGFMSLESNISGDRNTATGSAALRRNTTGSQNTANGNKALSYNTTGSDNIAIGELALYYNTTGSYNIAIGREALRRNTTISGIVAIGDSALYWNGFGATGSNGYYNTAVGTKSLSKNRLGRSNTAVGYQSLRSNLEGSYNTSVGGQALYANTHGSDNTAMGDGSLDHCTGDGNTALGHSSGYNITSGSENIIIGYTVAAPSATASNQLNIGNLIFGEGLDGIGTNISSGNIGIGTKNPNFKLDVHGEMQLKNNSGEVNLYLDASYGNPEIQFQESNAYMGAIGYSLSSDYLYLYEGGSVVLKDGNFGIGTTTPAHRLQVGNSGDGSTARANAWNTFSDRSLKKDLVVMENPTEKLNQLHGYYYYWKEGEDQNRQVGIIAQEVEEVLPEIVSTDADGIKSVDYSKLTPLLIEALKAQQKTISDLEARIKKLEN